VAWTIPPALGVDINAWAFQSQFWYAARERATAAGATSDGYWPRPNHVWYFGTVGAITATTLTDSDVTTDPDNAYYPAGWPTAPLRWVGYDNTAPGAIANAPTNYTVIIHNPCEDPRMNVRATITNNTATGLTFGDITEQLTERGITLASLVGKRFTLIRAGGYWWTQRILQWPSDQTFAEGTVDGVLDADGVAHATAAGTLTDRTRTTANWTVNEHTSTPRDVLFRNEAGALQRGRITANTVDTLTFTGTTGKAALAGAYAIVAAGGYYQFDRIPGEPFAWYTGLAEGFYSHYPDDSLTLTGKAQPTVDLTLGTDPFSCPIFPTAYTVFDVDLWTEITEACETADEAQNPNVNQSFRSLQVLCESICGSFADPTASFSPSIPLFTPATLFLAAGINAQTATAGTHTGTGLPITLTVPWTPIDVYICVKGANGESIKSDFATYNGTELSGTFGDEHDGRTVVVSLGWTRYVPREFRYPYEKTVWIPDASGLGDLYPAPVEPDLDGFGPGQWVTRPASTHYITTSTYGHVTEGTEARDAFADRDLARLVGDNWNDATLNPSDSADGGQEIRTEYYDRFYVGRRAKEVQDALELQRKGTATSGSTQHLTDNTKDWWSGDYYTGGTLITHEGTATSGSQTSLTDTTQAGSGFWDPARGDGRFVGHTVRILIDGDWDAPDAKIERRLITTHVGTTIDWAEPTSASANAKAYRIAEPKYELNKWKNRTVTLTRKTASGTQRATPTITGSDDQTVFFGAVSFPVDERTAYVINERDPGPVYLRSGGAWVLPTGDDPRGQPFHADSSENLPTAVVRYGRAMLGDYFFLLNYQELYRVLNLLYKTRHVPSWTNDPSGSSPENNSLLASYLSESIHSWAALQTELSTQWGVNSPGTGNPPKARYDARDFIGDNGIPNDSDDVATGAAERVYAYAAVSIPQGACTIARDVAFYVYATVDSDDHINGSTDYTESAPELEKIEWRFDANGDPVAYHQYTTWDTVTGATAGDVVSAALGSLTMPSQPTEPSPETDVVGLTANTGWYAYDVKAVATWAFTYLDLP
jgi:hypothetical protein